MLRALLPVWQSPNFRFSEVFCEKFVKTDETAVPKSGSPGYVVGAPLLAGYAVTDPAASSEKGAVSRPKDGLPIPAAGPDGRCGSPTFNSPVPLWNVPVSCAMPLTVSGSRRSAVALDPAVRSTPI